MFILKTGHQPGVYVPLRALFLVFKKSGLRNTCLFFLALMLIFKVLKQRSIV